MMEPLVRITLLCCMFIWAGLVFAVDDPPYTLTRIGSLSVGNANPNDQQMVGVVVGLRVNYSIYVEGEINLHVGGGDYAGAVEKGNMQISTLAIYGAYRYVLSPSYYFKAKAGLVYEDIVRLDNNSQNESSSSGSSGSGGIGLGIVYSLDKKQVMLEVEATNIEKNIFLYTVGMTYPF